MGYTTTWGKKEDAHRLWESKDLYFQASKSSISSLQKDLHFHVPVPSFNPSRWETQFHFFPHPPKHISTTPRPFRLFGVSDWLSAPQFARASVNLLDFVFQDVPLLSSGFFWLIQKNQKKNTAETRFWSRQTLLLASENKWLGPPAWMMLTYPNRSLG